MRHISQLVPLYATLACVAACGERSPTVPLRRDVPTVSSASLNGSAPVYYAADTIQTNLCAFDVRLQVNGKEKMRIVGKDQSITLITAPTLEVTLSNVANPARQVTLGITGAFHETTDANGNRVYVITGRNLVHSPAAGLLLTQGTFTYTLDADGNLLQPLSGRGRTTELCALIS